MKAEKELREIIDTLTELQQDASIPRNVKTKIENIISSLKEDTDLSIKANKALNALDEIANDINMQSYTRTQIWNAVSLLEKLTN